MRLPSNLVIACFFFVVAAVLLLLIFTHKHEPAVASMEHSDSSLNNYIEAAEKQNNEERDAREEAYKLAKLAKEKKESVECQFWTQQQSKKPSSKSAQKVTQFCEI